MDGSMDVWLAGQVGGRMDEQNSYKIFTYGMFR